MTEGKVVDASALASLLFGEDEGDAIAGRLEGAPLFAPRLLGFELANVCATKLRRQPERRELLVAGFAFWTDLDIKEVDVPLEDVLQLAITARLTAYDASYLWLARDLGVELITLDKQLIRAAAALD